ncbi:hypothetical protein [Agarivorans sp. Alg241-V36]|uniref:hypothetical protein n=1 Tax=Agarivorans sp. Alg241-V36 TaxID=2305992 RepID=UPI0013D59AAD|nr:hypothetical protein [Agarivorans sp. Alg241-V36]
MNGGFGDIILDSQFLLTLREQYPKATINVYYRDDEAVAEPSSFSWGKTRHYTSKDGVSCNPITEWLEALNCVDTYTGCNIDKLERGIRVFPESFHKFFGGYWTPNEFNNKVNTIIFKNSKSTNTLEHFNELLFNKCVPIVALHLRRNAQKIVEMACVIQDEFPDVHFVLLGSSEHQTVPDTNMLKNKTSLIDSYSKGLSTLELLSITQRFDLFIGGRGGFELFHWLSETPSVCFFDDMGKREIEQLWWHPSLWINNKINKLYFSDSKLLDVLDHINRSKVLECSKDYYH